jgi:heme/copper-type cytochrome/quinol oxidase subunit 2
MPIVVVAKPQDEFKAWLEQQMAGAAGVALAATE